MKRSICIVLLMALCFSLCYCAPKEYTITFYNNKGIYFYTLSGEERRSTHYQDNSVYKVVKCGEYPTEPTPPTNPGYVFLGWYQDPECTEKFLFGHYEINSDINLYAKWGKGK